MSRRNDMNRRTALKVLGAVSVVGASGIGLSLAKRNSRSNSGLSVKADWSKTFSESSDSANVDTITDMERASEKLDSGKYRYEFALAGRAHMKKDGEKQNGIWFAKTDTDGELLWD